MVIWLRPRLLGATAALAAVLAIGVPTAAEAHSLDSSTIAVQVTDTSIDAEVGVALETLDQALGTDYESSQADGDAFADEVITYIDDHLAVTGTDGTAWTQNYSGVVRDSVEGIDRPEAARSSSRAASALCMVSLRPASWPASASTGRCQS